MYDMKNPVRIGIPGLFSFHGNHWPLVFSVFLTAGALHAQQIPDWLLSATPDSFDLPGWSSPAFAERDFGNLVSFGGGLACLPAWVRRFPRVRNWTNAKLLVNAARWFRNHPESPALA